MKKLFVGVILLVIGSTPALAKVNFIEDMKVAYGQLKITCQDKTSFTVVVPEGEDYMYVDIHNVQIKSKKTKFELKKKQGFNSIKIGRHTNPSKVRFVLQALPDKLVPRVEVKQENNIIVLTWNPLVLNFHTKKLQAKGLTKVEDSGFFAALVEKVKGSPLKKSKAPLFPEIDASAPQTQKPLMEVVVPKAAGAWETFIEKSLVIYNDIKVAVLLAIDSLKSTTVETTAKVKEFFSDKSVAYAKEKTEPSDQIQQIKIVQIKKTVQEDTKKLGKPSSKPAKSAKIAKLTKPANSVKSLKVNTPQPMTPTKTYDKEIVALRQSIDTYYKKSLQAAKKIVKKETTQIQASINERINSKAETTTKQTMAALVKSYDTKLAQLEKQHIELKQQQVEISKLMSSVKSQKNKMDKTMREINARKSTIACREEPIDGYKVIFLPAGSLRGGLESLAKSVNLDLLWEAPRDDYYINRAIPLSGMTFDENLIIIHRSLAQNNVYFTLEPNYSELRLRVRANEVTNRLATY